MKEYNFQEVEAKWQANWEATEAFKAYNSSDKPKYYVLIEFPYPSVEDFMLVIQDHTQQWIS